jgi:hypothetical protein
MPCIHLMHWLCWVTLLPPPSIYRVRILNMKGEIYASETAKPCPEAGTDRSGNQIFLFLLHQNSSSWRNRRKRKLLFSHTIQDSNVATVSLHSILSEMHIFFGALTNYLTTAVVSGEITIPHLLLGTDPTIACTSLPTPIDFSVARACPPL